MVTSCQKGPELQSIDQRNNESKANGELDRLRWVKAGWFAPTASVGRDCDDHYFASGPRVQGALSLILFVTSRMRHLDENDGW
jgi:hypothetical protein